jgi:uncharacterized protein (DUF697 family)
MHDLDRTLGRTQMERESVFEFNAEDEYTGESTGESTGEYNQGEYNQGEAFEFTSEQEVFGEAEVNELAAELLSVANQQELNNFLGDLMKKAGSALGQVIRSPLGQQLGGMLKSAAKTALPVVGSAIGNAILPGVGGAVGGKLASMAGSMFGLETEGLSQEDRQFEVAKQFVRFGGDATQKALALSSQGTPLPVAAKTAVQQAAERFVPGLLAGPSASSPSGFGARHGRLPRTGTWVRQGSKLIINLARD